MGNTRSPSSGYGDEDSNTAIELTYNYGVEKYEMGGAFGHLAIGVPDVAGACEIAAKAGGTITRPAGPVRSSAPRSSPS